MSKEKIFNKHPPRFHHLPNYQEYPNIGQGLSIRKLLKELRKIDYGNIGGMHWLDLSDGTCLEICNRPACYNGELMNSQRVRRFEFRNGKDRTIRYYELYERR